MKKLLFYCLIAVMFFGYGVTSAQNVLDGVYIKEHTPLRKVTPLCHLREADVMWSRRIWRVIDLREKINIPLAYPKHDDTKDRKSMIDLLYTAVKEGTLTPYDYNDDEFIKPITFEEFEKAEDQNWIPCRSQLTQIIRILPWIPLLSRISGLMILFNIV